MPTQSALPPDAWTSAALLLTRWIARGERIDLLLETLPRELTGPARAQCQHRVLGVVRHHGRLEAALGRLVAHAPRHEVRAVLLLAGLELLEAATAAEADPGRVPRIVHHAVERTKTLASPAEARMVNAVVRRLAAPLAQPPPPADANAATLGEFFSHPVWLVQAWQAQFGPAATRALLEWNQTPAPVHGRWRGPGEPPAFLQPTVWPGFLRVPSGHWNEVEPLLAAGQLYLQDPSTRLPVELLAPQTGETLLDLCAAPGGKSLLIADQMNAGRLVALDQPGTRLERLKENLSRTRGVDVALVQADLLGQPALVLREHRLPETYDGVLLDVPCSNTGVMRHRVDVKWRLQPGDFRKHPAQQLSLLHAAARLVRPGGRLVYSTCSIDAEENEHVVRAFLAGKAGGPFSLEKSVVSQPWVAGHDGGGAFLLRKA